MSERTIPPFRADMVGSLLRPTALKEARAQRERGEITQQALRETEDRLILEAVRKQQSLGFRVVTDGEYRRGWWNHDFLGKIGGVEVILDPGSAKFMGTDDVRLTPQVRAKVHRAKPIVVDDFRYLAGVAKAVPKVTIPAPATLYHRGGRPAVSSEVYPALDAFWDDVGRAYREEIAELASAGCQYLQIDDVSYSLLCDPKFRAARAQRGDDPASLPAMFADALNLAISNRPNGMTIAMHTCRGNWKSAWMAEGGYEPVAEIIFQRINVDAYFLEYDTERAGGFEPLRFVPKTKKVVLGVVSTKTPVLESKDVVKRKIDEAAKYVPIENLCVSPQCGFASSHHGNNISEDEQWRKLELVVQIAREVWG